MSMKHALRESEARFLEHLMSFRDEYRARRAVEIDEERARRHASDEVYAGGCWIHRTEAGHVIRGLQRHELLSFVEIVVLLVLLMALAAGLWQLFVFLFLP